MNAEHLIREFLTENCATKDEVADALGLHWRQVQIVLNLRQPEWSINCDPMLRRTITRFHEGELCRYWYTRPNQFPSLLLNRLRQGDVQTVKQEWATTRTIAKAAEILQRYGAGILRIKTVKGRSRNEVLRLTHDLPLRLWPIDGVFPKLPVAVAPPEADLEVVRSALEDGCITVEDIQGHTAMARFRLVGYRDLAAIEKYVPQLKRLAKLGYTVEDLEDIPAFLKVYGMSQPRINRALMYLQGSRAPQQNEDERWG